MSNYFITSGQEQKGPYTLEQLRAMWTTGAITADAHYWTEGMVAWAGITDLSLDSQIQALPSNPVAFRSEGASQNQPQHIHHTGEIITKKKGVGLVAFGSVLCILGLLVGLIGGAASSPITGGLGALGFIVGFFLAVIGRMMS